MSLYNNSDLFDVRDVGNDDDGDDDDDDDERTHYLLFRLVLASINTGYKHAECFDLHNYRQQSAFHTKS